MYRECEAKMNGQKEAHKWISASQQEQCDQMVDGYLS